MERSDAAVVKSTAQTYKKRFGAKARRQAELRALELQALGSDASDFWWAVAHELKRKPGPPEKNGHRVN